MQTETPMGTPEPGQESMSRVARPNLPIHKLKATVCSLTNRPRKKIEIHGGDFSLFAHIWYSQGDGR